MKHDNTKDVVCDVSVYADDVVERENILRIQPGDSAEGICLPYAVQKITTRHGVTGFTYAVRRSGEHLGMYISKSIAIAILAARDRGVDVRSQWVKLGREGDGPDTRYTVVPEADAHVPQDLCPGAGGLYAPEEPPF